MKIIEVDTKEELHKATRECRTPAVYLLKCNEFYKIGRSNSILNRIDSMRTGNPYEIELLFFARTDKDLEVEKMLHNKFEAKRVRGEWFKLSNEDLIEFENILSNTWTKDGN